MRNKGKTVLQHPQHIFQLFAYVFDTVISYILIILFLWKISCLLEPSVFQYSIFPLKIAYLLLFNFYFLRFILKESFLIKFFFDFSLDLHVLGIRDPGEHFFLQNVCLSAYLVCVCVCACV